QRARLRVDELCGGGGGCMCLESGILGMITLTTLSCNGSDITNKADMSTCWCMQCAMPCSAHASAVCFTSPKNNDSASTGEICGS
ncbi:MAG: hypothetical protein ACKPKO_47075, partial [Candidatus Fonsibacter sp.]